MNTLDQFHVYTWQNVYAPADQRWSAALSEPDLDVKSYTGRTQREAVNELLDSVEQDNGELRA